MLTKRKRVIINGLGGAFLLWAGASIGALATDNGHRDINSQLIEAMRPILEMVQNTPEFQNTINASPNDPCAQERAAVDFAEILVYAAEETYQEALENLAECEGGGPYQE